MEVKQTRLNLLAKVAKYDLTRSELLECGDSEIIEARSTSIFTERELCAINTLLRDTDYVNSNILVTNIMSLSEKMVIKQELLEDARGKLSEVSQPQYKFSVNMDNFFRLPDYEVWANEFAPDSNGIPSGMLKFIRVGIRDDYMVKLRVIGYRWNPCEVTSDLTFEFSSMITSRTGRSDLTELLDQENNRGSKNSIRIGTGTAESEQEYINNIMELLKTNSIFTKAVQNIAGGVTGAVDPTTIENIIHNYISGGNINGLLSRVSIDSVDVGNITGLDGKFQDLAAEYITAGYIQSKIIDAETGKFKWLEAIDISAKTITADQIVAQGAEFTELASKIINAQQARIENIAAGTITANSVISAMGDFSTLFATNAFIEHLSTQTSSTIVSTVDSQYIKNQIVQHLTASDILAGDIVLSNSLRITSEDGGLIMNG